MENTDKILDDSLIPELAKMLDIDTGDWTSENAVKALKAYSYDNGIYGELRNRTVFELSNRIGCKEHKIELREIQGNAAMGNYVQNQMDRMDQGNGGVKFKAVNFINTNARKPMGSEKMALRYDLLNSYIYSKKERILDTGHSKTLAKILGVDTPWNGQRQTTADDLKGISFSEGGIAETLKTVPGKTGDDGWCVVQKGKAILNLPQTEIFKDLVNRLPELSKTMELDQHG